MEKTGLKGNTKAILLGLGGLAGGIANGLLGAGGGIVMTFVLEYVFDENDLPRRDLFANVIAAALPISVVSAVIYTLRGDIEFDKFGAFALPAVIGGLAGALLLSRIKTSFLKRIFALLVIWSGIYMILK
ncbi:MAG: TSUP family transporter [Eubacteriales bacterium]